MMTGHWSRRGRQGVVAAALVTLFGVGAFSYRHVWAAEPDTLTASSKPRSVALLRGRTAILTEMENGFSAIAESIEPSVVSIEVEKKMRTSAVMPDLDRLFRQFDDQDEPGDGGKNNDAAPRRRSFSFPGLPRGGQMIPQEFNARGSGSGVIVRSDGWILTNDHVVDGADKVTVTLHDGRTFTGTVRRDFKSDLAVVKINATGLEPVEFADSDRVRVGQWAIAFGSPFELNDTMTIGVVSARQRQRTIAEGGQARFYPSLIQTDASINPGNSGGALVDSQGRVMGINVAIGSPNGGNVGIGFAIPANTARDVMNQLITSGKVVRGYLGLKPSTLTPDARKRYSVSGGALVEEIFDDTPAAKAGFQVEDVIVKFDGKTVTDDIMLRDMVARTAPNRRVDVVVVRNGREQTIPVTVGDLPSDGQASAEPAKPVQTNAGGKLGIGVEPINAANTKQFNLPKTVTGVVVAQVEPGSAAAGAGIQPGDVIARVNGRSIGSGEDLRSAVQSARSGDLVRLVVQRGKVRSLVTVTMP